MNTAVMSESGYSSNFQPFPDNKYSGPYFNTEMEDPRFVEFFRSEKNYNNKMIPLKEWFEKNLRIPYPQTLITSWNGVFAVRSDLIKRRSLNFYKSLLGEVDRINAPVEAHFFERSWYYVFQEPISDLDAIYYCYKSPYATYESLSKFKKYHPFSKIFLISDNGYDYSEMAKHFNCEYTHLDESINTGFNWYKKLSHNDAMIKYNKFCEQFLKVCSKSTAKYIIKLEDDVSIQGPIHTSKLSGFINGPKIHMIPNIIFDLYYSNTNINAPSNVYHTGHGGCIYNREQLINVLTSRDIIDKLADIMRATGYLGGYMIDDVSYSIIGTILGYKLADNPEQMEIETEKKSKNIKECIILHQFKENDSKEMPAQLKHLVKLT